MPGAKASRRLGLRRRAFAAGAGLLLGVMIIGLVATLRAEAAAPRTISFSDSGADFVLGTGPGATFETVRTHLDTGAATTFDLAIPGLGDLLDLDVQWDDSTDALDQRVLAFTSGALDSLLPASSNLAGQDLELLFFAAWDPTDPTDTDPDVVLALKAGANSLSRVVPQWSELAGLPGQVPSFDEVVLPLTTPGIATLDPATLPASVRSFFDVGQGPLDETLSLESVLNLVADLDLSSMPALEQAAAFLGVDAAGVTEVVGTIAGDAALLFDAAAPFDGSQFALDGPVEVDSGDLPAWLLRGVTLPVPEFRFRLDPPAVPGDDPTANLRIHDEVVVTAGGIDQQLAYDVAIADMIDGDTVEVTVAAPTLQLPYDVDEIGWDGTLSDVALHLELDTATDEYSGSFDAAAQIGSATPTVHVEIADDPTSTRAIASVDGPLPIADVVGWLSGSAFPGGDFGPVDLALATVDQIEVSYDSGAASDVFGFFASVSDIEAFSEDLRVRVLVGAERDAAVTSVLTALRIDDDDCIDPTVGCLQLSEVLPIPGGSLGADISLPAVNLYSLVGADQFATDRLGSSAQAFLGEVLAQDPLITPTTLEGDLTFATDVPLGGLAPLFDALDITPGAPTVRLEGAASFAIPDLLEDPTNVSLQTFRVEATGPGFSATPFAGFPDWLTFPTTEDWTAYLGFDELDPMTDTDDTVVFGVAIDGVDLGALGSDDFDPPPFRLEASFAGNPAADDWTITARGAITTPWAQPFGIDWLEITALVAEVVIDRVPASGGDPAATTVSARLRGEFDVDSIGLAAEVTIEADEFVFTIELLETVTVGQLVAKVFSDGELDVPEALANTGFGPGALTLLVTGDRADVDISGTLSFSPYDEPGAPDPRGPISFSGLAAAGFSLGESFGLDFVTFGVQPQSELTLGRLLPPALAGTIPLDLPIVPPPPPAGEDPTSGFGLVFTFVADLARQNVALDDLSPTAQAWFAPLFGGDAAGRSVDTGFSALGAFALPSPLDDLVETIGFDPFVLASGSLPIPGLDQPPSLGLGLRVEVNQAVLDQIDLVDELAVSLELFVQSNEVKIELGLDGTLRFMQGLDPSFTGEFEGALDSIVVDGLTGAELGFDFHQFDAPWFDDPADANCPRGGVVALGPEDEAGRGTDRYFCYDLIDIEVKGFIGGALPSELSAGLEGTITSRAAADDPDGLIADAGWAPFGIDEVIIRQLGGRIEVGVNPAATPTPVSLVIGATVNGSAFGKTMAGAFQIGVNVGVTPSPPPVPVVRPNIEKFGLSLSLPGGLSSGELVELYQLAAEAMGTPAIDAGTFDLLPNFGVRDLFFSVSPFGVPELCIGQGLSLKGDLYVYTGDTPPDPPAPVCDDSGTPPPVPENRCLENKDQGCVASMLFSLTPTGIIAEGTVAAFDLAPLPISFTDDIEVIFRLTAEEQLIRLAGGVALGDREPPGTGPITNEWASGRMGFEMGLSQMEFAGRLDLYGFNVLVDGLIGLGDNDPFAVLTGQFNPELQLHVVLAAPELDQPQYAGNATAADFADVVNELVNPTLEDFRAVVTLLDTLVAEFASDPLLTLLALPDRLAEAGVALPPELVDTVDAIESEVQAIIDLLDLEADDAGANLSATYERILNGYTYPGVKSFSFPSERTCVAGIDLGAGFVTTFEWDPLEPIGPGNPTYLRGTEDDQGRCWTIEGVLHGFWVNPQCIGVEAPDLTQSGAPLDCYAIAPFQIPGACSTIFPAAADPGSIEGTRCTTAEVEDEIEALFEDLVAGLLDFAGSQGPGSPTLPDFSEVIDTIRGFLEPGAGPLFDLDCAEFLIDISLFGDTRALVALDATLFGQQLDFGVEWMFALGDALGIEGSVEDMVADFWRFLTQGGAAASCNGVDLAVFGEGGVDFGPQLRFISDPNDPSAPPPPPPPPVVAAAVSATDIVEDDTVELTIAFDRALTSADGPRTVEVDWDLDGSFSADEAVLFDVGDQSRTVSITYRDDDPTGTAADAVTIRVVDTGVGGGADTASLTVNNAPPEASIALDTTAVDENDSVELTVEWSDIGPLDTHDVTVIWGDGTSDRISDASTGLTVSHTYRDDDPSDTPFDDYGIVVTVVDDDLGVDVADASVRVSNVAPAGSGIVVTPASVEEGAAVTFTVAFDDVGPDDTHTVEVDFDNDGEADVTRTTNAGDRATVVNWVFADDDPDDAFDPLSADDFDIGVVVTDDDGGAVAVQRTVEVRNVAPEVCATVDPGGFEVGEECPDPQPLTLDEGGTAVVTLGWSDPGRPDTHTVTIDWGDDTVPDTVFNPPAGTRSLVASQAYGDNGTYAIDVTVVDDDLGVGTETLQVIVNNVDPTVVIDETAAVSGDGTGDDGDGVGDDDGLLDVPTLLGRAGEAVDFSARATDPGSDDLTFTWDWDATDRFDTSSTSTRYRVNPPADDPLPSPSVQPRDITDQVDHSWDQACLYEIGLVVDDDDGGAGIDATSLVVTGTDHRVRRPGWWYNQYDPSRRSNRNSLSEDTLGCYLEIVQHMSRVFHTTRDASTSEAANDVLNTRMTSSDDEIMVRQLLATWLNFAHGSIGWFDVVDTDGDGIGDTPFHVVLAASEELRLDPTATRDALLAQEDVLEIVNGE